MVTGCGTGCGRIFAIIMKDATEDDIGESYLEDRMWPCVTSAMLRIWNIEDHHSCFKGSNLKSFYLMLHG